jgi:hypothetical protein
VAQDEEIVIFIFMFWNEVISPEGFRDNNLLDSVKTRNIEMNQNKKSNLFVQIFEK